MTLATILRRAALVLFLCCADSLAAGAQNWVELRFAQVSDGTPSAVTILINSHFVATLNDDGEPTVFYDRQSRLLTLIDHWQRTYINVDRRRAQKVARQLSRDLDGLMAQLNELPDEHRRLFKGKLDKFMSDEKEREAQPLTRFTPSGERASFAALECEWYRYTVDMANPNSARTCLATRDTVPGGAGLLEMLDTFSLVYDELSKIGSGKLTIPLPENPMAPMSLIERIPLSIQEPRTDKRLALDMTLQSVNTQAKRAVAIADIMRDYSENPLRF